MTTTEAVTTPALTETEITILEAAGSILLGARGKTPATFDGGIFAEACMQAREAITRALIVHSVRIQADIEAALKAEAAGEEGPESDV